MHYAQCFTFFLVITCNNEISKLWRKREQKKIGENFTKE